MSSQEEKVKRFLHINQGRKGEEAKVSLEAFTLPWYFEKSWEKIILVLSCATLLWTIIKLILFHRI